jgi:hypothetical protein
MSNCEQRQHLNGALPRLLAIGVGAIFCSAMVGCGAPVPTERLQTSAAAIRAAEEVGADRVPEAQLHLQLAKEQCDRAKKMIDTGGDRDEAKLVLARAESDANLALALARTSQEQHQAQVAADRVQSLKSQNGQK